MSWFLNTLTTLGVTSPPKIFVETGAYKGDGIAALLSTKHFTTIHSLELSPIWVVHCRERFRNEPNVHLHQGDSSEVLKDLLSNGTLPPSEPILFYLDAHFSGGETAGENIDQGCPVLRELEIIKTHRNILIPDVIIIDDMRLMGKASWGGSQGDKLYPLTHFDFRHAQPDIMKALMSHKRVYMSQSPDRLVFY